MYCSIHQNCKNPTVKSEKKIKIPVKSKKKEIPVQSQKKESPAQSQRTFGLDNLNDDILINIASYLDYWELTSLCHLSKSFDKFCNRRLKQILLIILESSGFHLNNKWHLNELMHLLLVSNVPRELPRSHFIDDSGQVYAWGENTSGQLGFSDAVNRSAPELVPFFTDKKVIQVDDNSLHTSFITDTNQIYFAGVTAQPELVFSGDRLNIVQLSGTLVHQLLLTTTGQVYGMGSNRYGQLGLGQQIRGSIHRQFVLIDTLPKTKIIQVCTNGECSLFLTCSGQVYACGHNSHGQLGVGDRKVRYQPECIKGLGQIIQVSMGQSYSLFLTNTGSVYACGFNAFGQMGVKGEEDDHPTLITTFLGEKIAPKIIQISAGRNHSLFLASNGQVYTCGSNSFGQLGITDQEIQPIPVLIRALMRIKIVRVSAGYFYSFFLTSTGQFYACGRNGDGQLGLGDLKSRPLPERVVALSQLNGSQFGGHRVKFQKQPTKVMNRRRNTQFEGRRTSR